MYKSGGRGVDKTKVTEYRSGCVRFAKIFLLGMDYHIFSILWGPSRD